MSDASYTPYGEHYANGFNGYFAGNLSISPIFMDGYGSATRLHEYNQGRWISPDKAGLSAVDPTNPQTWNRYAYVANNPLNNIDPSGQFQYCPWGTVPGQNICAGPPTTNDFYVTNCDQAHAIDPSIVCGPSTPSQPAVTNTGGGGTTASPAASNTANKQTFNQCMAAHANDFSILGALNAGTNALLNRHDTYKDNVVLGALGGNSITSLIYGSTADAAGTGVTLAPTIVTAAMGTATSTVAEPPQSWRSI